MQKASLIYEISGFRVLATMFLFKKIVLWLLGFFLALPFAPAFALQGIVLENAKQAETISDFFATSYENQVEPLNWREFTQLYLIHGGPIYGKALLVFDIGEDGHPKNLVVLQRNRGLIFGPKMKKFFETHLQFEKGNPQKQVFFEVGFCGRDLCKIYFKRLAGPDEPLILEYKFSYYGFDKKRKGKCTDLVVGFDVNKQGLAQNIHIISSANPGQHETAFKNTFKRFRFEKNKPARDIELLVRLEYPGFCKD